MRQLQQSFQIGTGLSQAVVAGVWSGNWEREMPITARAAVDRSTAVFAASSFTANLIISSRIARSFSRPRMYLPVSKIEHPSEQNGTDAQIERRKLENLKPFQKQGSIRMRKSWTPGISIRPGRGESPSPDGPLEIQGAAGRTSGRRRNRVYRSGSPTGSPRSTTGSPRTTSKKNSPKVLKSLDRFSVVPLKCVEYPIWYVDSSGVSLD